MSFDRRSVFDILLREDFRKFLMMAGDTDGIIIDVNEPVFISDCLACYRDSGKWIVYETDERGRRKNESTFTQSLYAYKNLAKRRGLDYDPSFRVMQIFQKPRTKAALKREILAIQSAIGSLTEVNNLCSISSYPNAVKADLQLLHIALEEEKNKLKILLAVEPRHYSSSERTRFVANTKTVAKLTNSVVISRKRKKSSSPKENEKNAAITTSKETV